MADASITEADLFETIREAVCKQRVPEIDLAGFEAALREAMEAAFFAGERAGEVMHANSLELAAKRALSAIKANEDATSRIKALKKILLGVEGTLDDNRDDIRRAFGLVLQAIRPKNATDPESVIEDDFHTMSPLAGEWSMVVYSPGDVSWAYLMRVPDKTRLRTDLLAKKPDDAVGVFEDPSIAGARLVQGEPGVKIALKRKQRRATG